MGGYIDIDVGSVVHQLGENLNAPHAYGHQQGAENVQVGVSAGLQQHGGSLDVVVGNGKVERALPPVLIKPGAVIGQLCIHIEASLDQDLQYLVPVPLSSKVEWANATATNSRLTSGRY